MATCLLFPMMALPGIILLGCASRDTGVSRPVDQSAERFTRERAALLIHCRGMEKPLRFTPKEP